MLNTNCRLDNGTAVVFTVSTEGHLLAQKRLACPSDDGVRVRGGRNCRPHVEALRLPIGQVDTTLRDVSCWSKVLVGVQHGLACSCARLRSHIGARHDHLRVDGMNEQMYGQAVGDVNADEHATRTLLL